MASDNMTHLFINIPGNIVMFDGLDREELSIVAKYMDYRDVEPGEYVFKEGEKGSYMCFVAEGALEILKKNVKKAKVLSFLRYVRASLLARWPLLTTTLDLPPCGPKQKGYFSH